MKPIFKITAAVLAAGMAVTLAGCAGCAGCSGTSVNTIVTNSNWYTGTSYKGIQPSFIADDGYAKEVITYGVTLDSTLAKNPSYTVEYSEGVYTTEFYATHYNWKDSASAYKTDTEKTELVYCYRTELHISGKYTLKSDSSAFKKFDDSVVTVSYFRAANKSLQPVYSEQDIKSTSPNKRNVKTIDEACKSVEVKYKNYYSPDCKEVITYVTEAGKQTEQQAPVNLEKLGNTLFDNSSLYIAMRSMNISASQTVSLYAPAAGGATNYTVTPTTDALGDEIKAISAELADKKLFTPVTIFDKGIPVEDTVIKTTALSVNNVGSKLSGKPQTVWYAAIENADNNTARSTMLKISIPLSYELGTLNFTLKEVNSTIWTGNAND